MDSRSIFLFKIWALIPIGVLFALGLNLINPAVAKVYKDKPVVDLRIDLNKASADEIAFNLKGIGPSKAERIVEWREKNGPFTSVRDVLQVKGIGEKTLQVIRHLIKVEPPKSASTKNANLSHKKLALDNEKNKRAL